MNSNELREYVRKLNEQEQVKQELRRQAALTRIRELREQIREQSRENVADHN